MKTGFSTRIARSTSPSLTHPLSLNSSLSPSVADVRRAKREGAPIESPFTRGSRAAAAVVADDVGSRFLPRIWKERRRVSKQRKGFL